jgi:hexosaminidase
MKCFHVSTRRSHEYAKGRGPTTENENAMRSHDCERGTQECVRHAGSTTYLLFSRECERGKHECSRHRGARTLACCVSTRGDVFCRWLVLCVLSGGLAGAGQLALMPLPQRVVQSEGTLKIDGSFSVRVAGCSDQRLVDGVARFVKRMSRETGIPISGGGAPSLTVECRASGPALPTLGEDESYQLDVTPAAAHLTAPTVTGALRGLETFSQLIAPGADSFVVPALRIEDRPRFPWRGLMLDTARHWMPLPVIERNLDAMAAVKLNVFHWHLSDDQGFRVESKLFPKLHQLGSDGHFYSQAEVRHIVAYARDRGIRVIPELDVPGHTTCWFVGYPELASAPGPYQIERKWGIFEPTLDPTREEVYAFLDALIGEMAGLFPDPYFHVGGDEVLDAQWKHNAAIQAFSAKHGFKTSEELHGYFNQRVYALVEKHGKKMIGWDEVLQPGVSTNVMIQSWRGQKSLRDAARKGYRGILSYGYYLDHIERTSFHYQIDPLGAEAAELNAQEAALVVGGEACMWNEYATEETVDSRLWPRLAAIAERLWSPRETTNIDSMYRRMELVSRWLDWTGVKHRSEYARMLDRLSGGAPTPALRVLADTVEAQGIGIRQEARKYSVVVPLNRLVDAARPESESVRCLTENITRWLGDPGQHSAEAVEARLVFNEWNLNDARLRPVLASSFLLQEVRPLSEDLSRTGQIGLRALQYLESGEKAPGEWLRQQIAELNRIEQPKAEVVLAAVRPVRVLLEALSRPAAQTGSH